MNIKKLCLIIFALLLVTVIAGCAPKSTEQVQTAALPVMKGYADGKEIYFTHLETSDEGMAKQLTDMFQSPVFFVPSLAKAPAETLANVYSFKNGIKGQVSVFDNPPGMDSYSPLRQLIIVVWADEIKARELKSVTEIVAAKDAGELAVKPTGVVINMPFVVWDGGKR